MASLIFGNGHFANLFVAVCFIVYFSQNISAQNDYVDFLRKANDRLTVDLLSALAGNFIYYICIYYTLSTIITLLWLYNSSFTL